MEKVLLIGTGAMAVDYAKVLNGLKVDFVTVGRGEEKCISFKEATGTQPVSGGIEAYLENHDCNFSYAIVSTEASALSHITCFLMEKGIKNILTEKPGGLSKQEIQRICDKEQETNSNVYIAYNRRFYQSVYKAKEIIDADGGVKSFNFEFTEWPHTVLSAGLPKETLTSWFLCNSTHVVDLAFHLGGFPNEFTAFSHGSSDWTSEKVVFAGAGISESGALFNYSANWKSPGRWSLEFLTDNHRLIFRPVEKLQIQELRSVKIDPVEIDYAVDTDYKPGLFDEVSSFLNIDISKKGFLKTMKQQLNMMDIYEKIAGHNY